MRKLHFIVKFIVAFIVATFAVALCIRYDASDGAVIFVYLGTGIVTMLALGAFDESAKRMNIAKQRKEELRKAA